MTCVQVQGRCGLSGKRSATQLLMWAAGQKDPKVPTSGDKHKGGGVGSKTGSEEGDDTMGLFGGISK